ncbi:MAG: glycan-binding surface protein [Paludibacter sp.]|nr:glycan-binding surface protein [Paludibacter sp.]
MKKIYKSMPVLLIALAILGVFASCNKEDVNKGTPQITYVRITKANAADSLIVSAGQGQLIAIIGDNLQDAREVWFNDRQASLTPTYISKNSILVSVPTIVPVQINNKLKIIFSSGDSLLYDFSVKINKPEITSMDCEYVLDGKVATLRGNYFYLPLTVTFPGDVQGTNVSVDETNKILTVTVPAGTTPGQITVTSNFGTSKSDFWFKDNRNIFISSDPYQGWWNASFVVNSPGTADVPAINGNYIRIIKILGAWGWQEIAGGPANTMLPQSQKIPDDAILNPSLYNFKFEVCTTKPYNGSGILFTVGTQDGDHGNYNWAPPYDTKGQWQTVVIPYDEVVKAYTVKPTVNHDGYWARVVFQGPTGLDCDMSFDNFRVVPKVSQ